MKTEEFLRFMSSAETLDVAGEDGVSPLLRAVKVQKKDVVRALVACDASVCF